MVVSAKMEHSVHQEYGQLFVDRSPGFLCLAEGGRQRNHDIPERLGDRAQASRHHGLTDGESQHIGRAILPAVFPVQPSHPSVSDQFQAQIRSRFSDCRQNTFGEMRQCGLFDGKPSHTHAKIDGHQ
jgi:hypothetical protein